jgi:hypothetical protein
MDTALNTSRLDSARTRTLFGFALVAGILAALALELCTASASASGANPRPRDAGGDDRWARADAGSA